MNTEDKKHLGNLKTRSQNVVITNESGKNEYKKLKKVGEGTYAVVYLGKNVKTNSFVAIKETKIGSSKDGIDISALKEIKYLQELDHQNIIKLIDIFLSPETIELVLEFLPCDLEALIKNNNIIFKPQDVKAWLLMTIRGVNYCHRFFILHRDLKPSNLLLASDGQLKIADFGLARTFGNPSDDLTLNVVTRWYRAPELLFGAKHYTNNIDTWSIGLIFAELLLRTPYLPGKDDLDQLDLTFKAFGTPTEKTWPFVSSLKLYNTQKMYLPPTKNELKDRFSALTENGLNLLISMTQLNPNNRITLDKALFHKYFSELPWPSNPVNLPKLKFDYE